MKQGASKADARRFAEDAMKRRPDAVSVDQIVYLDEDIHTYKYFMTGKFDEEARKQMILAQQAEAQKRELQKDSSRD